MKNILLIAGLQEQYYFQPFVDACKNRDVSIYLCDPSRYPAEAVLCVTQDRTGRIDGYLETMRLDGNSFENARVTLADIHTAWYLRENYAQEGYKSLNIETRFANNETRQALRALLSVLPCKWVNRSESIDYLNSNKLHQQLIATRCGLSVPRTIVSNSPISIEQFSDVESGLLLKSIGYIKLDDVGNYALYSERFSHKELISNDVAIRTCPIYGQEYVEKLYEHRVMVIGQRVLSCRIDSQASIMTKIDWRHYDFDNVGHKQVDLPKDVQGKLLHFMAVADLRYGALDLIETPKGDFVFLEVNPSGQWGWIADLAGLPIPEAVADMLESL
ncbi:MAG: hypothetical protein UY07_C0026G0003 [Parcubacteria group bacterium GW2011_GWA1_47_8]|nr:MAG: hypothetical protein UY07_C0026G0003 [Parcubacteria group bacterium GW2011_GWA1_47_8]